MNAPTRATIRTVYRNGGTRMKPEDLASAPPARLPFPVTRALAPAIECRAAADPAAMPTMVGHFSTFGDWYEVDSWIEGHFMESVGKGAFTKTIAEGRDQMKSLYDHGQDPQIGNKVLGPIEDLRVDKIGPAFAVPLFDTSYNRDLRPGLEAGVYGSSFRFTVEKDAWNREPDASAYNPKALPERTITEARVFEFGPVTFPANPNATAAVRSTTDTFYQRSRDPEAFETLLRSAQVARTPATAGAAIPSAEPPSGTPEVTPPEPPRSDTPRTSPAPQIAAPSPKENRTMDSMTRDEMGSRINELTAALERQATEFPGVMPADAQAAYDRDKEEFADVSRNAAAWDSRQADLERIHATRPDLVEPVYSPIASFGRKSEADIYDRAAIRNLAGTPEQRTRLLRDNAMRSVEQAVFGRSATPPDKTREHIAYLLDEKDTPDGWLADHILATGSPIVRRAYNKFLAGQPLTAEEQRAAPLTTGVTTTGGFKVPYVFDPTLLPTGAWTSVNSFRAACRVEQITTGNTWKGVSAGAVTATRTTEAAAATEQGPTFAQPSVTVERVHVAVRYSIEHDEDNPNLGSDMAMLIGRAKDTEEEATFALGAGTAGIAWGMFSPHATLAWAAHTSTATAHVLAAADLDTTEDALGLAYRMNAAWFMHRKTMRAFQALETVGGRLFGGTNGYPNVGPLAGGSPTGNTGRQLLGYPLWEVPSAISDLLADDTQVVAVFGDPKEYIIVDRIGMQIEIVPHWLDTATGYPTGQRILYAWWRNSARPVHSPTTATATGMVPLCVAAA